MKILNREELFALIEKRTSGTSTAEEDEILNQWFDEAPVLEELTFISEDEKENIKSTLSAAILEKISTNPGDRVAEVPAVKKFKRKWSVMWAAAALLCFSGIGLYYFLNSNDAAQIVVTVPRGIAKMPVTLPDSSLVWLYEGSSISYPEQFQTHGRNVTLNGVGFFSVRPDKTAPFTIGTTKSLSVKVVGTSFVVDAQKASDAVDVGVVTGIVQVNAGEARPEMVSPGERLSYQCKEKTFSKKTYTPEEASQWKSDENIYLDAVSIKELGILLQAVYHVNLVEAGQERTQRFNLSFARTASVDEVLGMLNLLSNLRFERNGDDVKIRG